MGLPWAAMAASRNASDNVGCAWQVRAMSSDEAPYSIARTASPIISPALDPMMCTPRIFAEKHQEKKLLSKK